MIEITRITCDQCGADFPIGIDEPCGTCPDCESEVQNPEFKFHEGAPESTKRELLKEILADYVAEGASK